MQIKNITTGEGGIVVTDIEDIYLKAKYFKNMCFPVNGKRNYLHEDIGFNYRMSNLHAAIGLAQTEKADFYRDLRINNNKLYKKYLSDCPGIIFQKDEENSLNCNWMNSIVIDSKQYGRSRDEIMVFLKEKGVDTRLLFNGMHRQPALNRYGCDCSREYKVTDYLSDNGFYLPSGSGLKEEEIYRICSEIMNYRK